MGVFKASGQIFCLSSAFCAVTTNSTVIEVSDSPGSGHCRELKTSIDPRLISCTRNSVGVISDSGSRAAMSRCPSSGDSARDVVPSPRERRSE